MRSSDPQRSGRIGRVVDYYSVVARHIDRELRSRDDERMWREIAAEHAPGPFLEVGTGTGRVTRLLLPEADRLAGVDLSPHMLERCADRLGERPGTLLVRADVLRLPVAPDFALAVAANGVFSHLLTGEGRARAVRETASRIRPGGTFLVDALWFSAEERDRLAQPDGRTRHRELEAPRGTIEVQEQWTCDPRTRRCSARYRYRYPDGEVDRAQSEFRSWTADELRSRLADAGLELEALWGDYERTPWDAECSKRLVARARRQR